MNINLAKTQSYLEWLKDKLYLNAIAPSAQRRTVFRGQVYRCKLGIGVGSEECKERPCVILQYNSANKTSPNTIVAPITHTSATVPVVVPIADKLDASGNTILDGNVLLGNIICISKARLGNYIADLTDDEMNKIDTAIAFSLGIKHHYDTLLNIYNDKLNYIEKLKQQREESHNNIQAIENLLAEYGFNDITELAEYLKNCKSR
jgi:mRNA-degrading endonuclease toxin of MazEF toxin-antitoxin module